MPILQPRQTDAQSRRNEAESLCAGSAVPTTSRPIPTKRSRITLCRFCGLDNPTRVSGKTNPMSSCTGFATSKRPLANSAERSQSQSVPVLWARKSPAPFTKRTHRASQFENSQGLTRLTLGLPADDHGGRYQVSSCRQVSHWVVVPLIIEACRQPARRPR
jgi:hypothetical protein